MPGPIQTGHKWWSVHVNVCQLGNDHTHQSNLVCTCFGMQLRCISKDTNSKDKASHFSFLLLELKKSTRMNFSCGLIVSDPKYYCVLVANRPFSSNFVFVATVTLALVKQNATLGHGNIFFFTGRHLNWNLWLLCLISSDIYICTGKRSDVDLINCSLEGYCACLLKGSLI